jgi:hypothetical protein
LRFGLEVFYQFEARVAEFDATFSVHSTLSQPSGGWVACQILGLSGLASLHRGGEGPTLLEKANVKLNQKITPIVSNSNLNCILLKNVDN